ncbi:MAG TPA: sigma-70 family RNA polymerase sigma factor [Polyangia bacterium]
MPETTLPRLALVSPEAGGPASGDGSGAAISFDEAYARHAGYVAGLVGRILGRNDDVPDVVQDVFLIAHRRLHSVRSQGSLRAWLGRIAIREASRRLRWRRVRLFLQPARTIEADLVADDGAKADLQPLVALLYSTLDRVPPRERVAWVLRHLQEEPLDTVAELCGCSIATAKRRIAAAELLLRPILGPGEGDE